MPQNVTVTAGNRSLTVTWEAPTSADATSYKVQYKLSTATTWTDGHPAPTPAALTETITIANSEFKSYDVQVLATNSDGDSAWTDAVSATPNRDIDTDSLRRGESESHRWRHVGIWRLARPIGNQDCVCLRP